MKLNWLLDDDWEHNSSTKIITIMAVSPNGKRVKYIVDGWSSPAEGSWFGICYNVGSPIEGDK